MPYIIGVDIGGTFTDAVAIDTSTGETRTEKVRTTPNNLVSSVVNALDLLKDGWQNGEVPLLDEAVKFAHGTTQTSNVMFTWSGARVGVLSTRGFADELLMMRARGRVMGVPLSARRHFRMTDKPPQLVPRKRIAEVSERIDHRGNVVVPLTESEARRAVQVLIDQNVEAIAIALLWSPVNSAHELLLERVIREMCGDIHVSLSHRLAGVLGEYERTATTVVNAYVAPTLEKYLASLSAELQQRGFGRPMLVLQSSGGVVGSDETIPVNTIESGPAAGMVATKRLAEAAGYRNVIATDVGGTTFKVGLLVDGQWFDAPEMVINQYTILTPAIDIVSIGSGGGSVAWVDDTRLRIGPESAGGEPGPACYGLGGTRPTVTDADVVLGFIDPDQFLGGRFHLHRDLAEAAISAEVAELFDGDVMRAAAGIRRVVDSQMGDLVRKTSIERGYHPRDFILMAYGGAGPLHAADYARAAGVSTVLVPLGATAYSAFGAAASDIHHSFSRAVDSAFPANVAEMLDAFSQMVARGTDQLRRSGISDERIRFLRWADMRYDRQLHNVRVPLEVQSVTTDNAESQIRTSFERRYEAIYGFGSVLPGAPLRVLRVGVTAIGMIDKPDLVEFELRPPEPSHDARRDARPVMWPSASVVSATRVWDGLKLRSGNVIEGPALIELPGTVIAVPPDHSAVLDRFGNTVIELP